MAKHYLQQLEGWRLRDNEREATLKIARLDLVEDVQAFPKVTQHGTSGYR